MKKLSLTMITVTGLALMMTSCEDGWMWPPDHPPFCICLECNDDEDPPDDNILVDERDGQEYRTVELAGLRWMAENLNYETENSWVYNDDPEMGAKYGRLYTRAAASAACPNGWRLASERDWFNLVRAVDGHIDPPFGEIAYEALMIGGNSGFDALLGGLRSPDGTYSGEGSSGYYWTSDNCDDSEDEFCDPGAVWYYDFQDYGFGTLNGRVDRGSTDAAAGLSCRCIRN